MSEAQQVLLTSWEVISYSQQLNIQMNARLLNPVASSSVWGNEKVGGLGAEWGS